LLRLPDGSSSERANERDNRSIVGRVERNKNDSLYPQIHSYIYLKLHISLRFYHPSLYPAVRLSIPCSINSLRRAGKKIGRYCWLVHRHEARINTSEDNSLQAHMSQVGLRNPRIPPPFVMMFCIGRFMLTFLILCLNFTAQMYSIIARMRL